MSRNIELKTGKDVRDACRRGDLTSHTAGLAPGYVQANLVILPKEYAADFEQFCHQNSKACPLLDISEPGNPSPPTLATDADLRYDLPCYRIWKDGVVVDEPTNLEKYWRDDLVSFLIGCSFTFENALKREGVPLRHVEENKNVAMYRTNIECHPVGPFDGHMVVSMRPLTLAEVSKATEITSRFPEMHGGPVHHGEPERIGITDLDNPDYGEAITIKENEIPVFWACGVTPQAVVAEAKLPFAITHAPGCMFVSDHLDADYEMV
ncbi:MAG: putative hydro-lyase [Planctomycetaceae bacterium]|nr:putative hydro-lyase [Planctomycetaceae bacterium]